MIEGSCLCNRVKYEYAGELGTMTVCHCSDCRKAQGTGNVIAVPVSGQQIRWMRGQEWIREYESSPGKKRAFCGNCGTPLYSQRDDMPQVLRLRVGTIDTELQARPAAHIFVANLPAWALPDDDCPRYERHEPGRR